MKVRNVEDLTPAEKAKLYEAIERDLEARAMRLVTLLRSDLTLDERMEINPAIQIEQVKDELVEVMPMVGNIEAAHNLVRERIIDRLRKNAGTTKS